MKSIIDYNLFFDLSVDNEDIRNFVYDQIHNNEENIFKLNEPFSCVITLHDSVININGDEDFKQLEIMLIHPTKLLPVLKITHSIDKDVRLDQVQSLMREFDKLQKTISLFEDTPVIKTVIRSTSELQHSVVLLIPEYVSRSTCFHLGGHLSELIHLNL